MYKVILATRYLLKRRITYLAVIAVALCVFTVVVVMTVLTGLVGDFKVKNHNWVGDCVVSTDSLVGFPYYEEFLGILEKQDFVEAAAPAIKIYALITYEGYSFNENVQLMGIEPGRHCKVTSFGDTLHFHKQDCLDAFRPSYDPNLAGGILGTNMVVARKDFDSYRLRQNSPQFSFSISAFPLTAKGALAKGGLGLVNTKTFYFSDDSLTGLARVDGHFVYLPLEDVQKLCGMGGDEKRVSAIHVKFSPNTRMQQGCQKIDSLWKGFVEKSSDRKNAKLLGNVTVQSWKSYRRQTIAAMEKEQVMMTAIFAMIGIITVFIIFVIFQMIIHHKIKDVGILKSIGVSTANIVKLFSGFAFLVGVTGSSIGALGGWLFLLKINPIEGWLFEHFGFQLWDRTLYAIGDIPNTVDLRVLAVIILSAIVACLVGAIVPSWQAARLEAVDTLQVNQL